MFDDLSNVTRDRFLYGLRVPGYWDGIGDAPFTLADIHTHIGIIYTDEQVQMLETLPAIEQGKIRQTVRNNQIFREKTLTYLQKLLEDGVVKVGQWWGEDGTADEYLGTPDEIIERIHSEWNATKEGVVNENPTAYEMSIHIVLKENPWPMWR